MRQIQNPVLTIAGFDPSAGAGVLADVKTFEQIGVYGCGISTCITYQNDIEFDGVKWLPFTEIEAQFQPLKQRFNFEFAKIGLVEDVVMLKEIVSMLKAYNPVIKIIWDPVLKTSSGYSFHDGELSSKIAEILKDIFLVTPNQNEAEMLNIDTLNSRSNLLVTGHTENQKSFDTLYSNGDEIKISGPYLDGFEKHGSGCVLSASITAFLALGDNLEDSCRKAKDYTFQFLQSNQGLLGHHKQIKIKEDADAIPY